MKEEMKIKISQNLAYWVGVMQTDGCLYKSKNSNSWNINIDVSEKSLDMLKKFAGISNEIFNLKNRVIKRNTRDSWRFHQNATYLLNTFSKLNIEFGDPPTPPNWVLRNSGLFGAYLAGIIDGDGSIRAINKDRPQMRIKVTSGKTQSELAKVIKERFSCWVKITKREKDSILKGRKIHGKFYELEFNVSGKNYKFIYKYILPHLALQYKKERLQSFIVNRFIYGVVG